MEKLLCRSFQAIMKVGMYLLPWGIPDTIKGPGSIKELPAKIKKDKCQNVLIVSDHTLVEIGLINPLLKAFDDAKLNYVLFDDIMPNPTDVNVEDGVHQYLRNRCDAIVMFGGGSPMDCGKAIAARIARPKRMVPQLQGLFKVLAKVPRMYAIPTTSGTGSETTIAAVITDSKTHHKASINDLCLIPKVAVLDPELTVGLPKHITATTGMDALCHAVEAYTNHTYNSRLENDFCRRAVRLIHDNLLIAYNEPENLEARQNMQLAAFYAGRAFTRGCVGYVHAIGHTLSGLYGTPHGLAMAILLPKVMRAYGPKAEKYLAELADVCALEANNDSDHARAMEFIKWIEEANKEMDIPEFPPILKASDVDTIVEWAHKEGNPLYPTPVVWTKKDFRNFLEKMITE